MGRLFVINLEGSIYKCKHCFTDFALFADVLSRSFHCRHGKAFLIDKVVNITEGEEEERMMMTGMHNVADIYCVSCGSIVGWKYLYAHENSQKYKEGKFVLERFKIWRHNLVNQEALAVEIDGDDDDEDEYDDDDA